MAAYSAINEYQRVTDIVKNIPLTCEQGLVTTKYKFNELKKEHKLMCQTLDKSNIYWCSNEDIKICVITIDDQQLSDPT